MASLLGGIARCGKCGAGLVITSHKNTDGTKSRRYACRKDPARPERGGLSIDAAQLDELLAKRLLDWLARPRKPSGETGNVGAALARMAMLTERRRDIDDAYRARAISSSERHAGITAGAEALRQVEAQLLSHRGGTVITGAPYGDRAALGAWWDGLEVAAKRSLIELLTRRVTIRPGGPGRGFDAARVRMPFTR